MTIDARRPRGATPRRAIPNVDPAVARLSEMLLALLSQVTVIRERLDTVERLIESKGLFKQTEVDGFAAGAEAETERDALRRAQIEKVMRPLVDDTERSLRMRRGEKST